MRTILTALLQAIIKDILEAPIPKEIGTYDRQTLGMLKDLYNECLDETKLDEIGMTPLLNIVRVVRGLYNGSTNIDPESYVHPHAPRKTYVAGSSEGLTAAISYMHSRGKILSGVHFICADPFKISELCSVSVLTVTSALTRIK